MRRVTSIFGVAIALANGTAGMAQERRFTPALTCSAIKAIVAREQHVELASSEYVYEMVHLNTGSCDFDQSSAPAFEPSSDERSCMAGWRCKQRNNSDSNK